MKFILRTIFLCAIIFSSQHVSAQQNDALPKGLTEVEKGLITDFQFTSTVQRTPAPSSPVRAAAEWEEVEYLVVTWENNYPNILRQIVAVGVQEAKVIIVTQNENGVNNYLENNGIDTTNITYLNREWDSIWIRDYAGNTVYTDDVGERALVDWIYNRPRPNDNTIPSAHAELLDIPIYITDTNPNDLVNTGGNYMSDGLGNAFASELILEENAAGNPYNVTVKSESQIDQIMEDYMGITNYIKMETLPYDAIHHIDMHMKLLDEETLLVSRYPEGVADGPQIEENIDYVLSNFNSPFGTPYKVKWIDAPPSTSGAYPDTNGYYRTYSNSIIINKSILVPTYRPEVDAAALAYYEELMPGYNVVGIDVDEPEETLIAAFGAIHCITHTIGVDEPLLIVHQPVANAAPSATVAIEASIKHISDVAQAKVYWREQGDTVYQEVAMSSIGDDMWTAAINMPSSNIDVEYYIWAAANSGKSLARPLVAPAGYWRINVDVLATQEYAAASIAGPYPNPTTDEVRFNFTTQFSEMKVTITNILGQELFHNDFTNVAGELSLDLKAQWQGTLFVTFSGDFGNVTKKILKL
jgi:agmatine/peptidylarginine deiminase